MRIKLLRATRRCPGRVDMFVPDKTPIMQFCLSKVWLDVKRKNLPEEADRGLKSLPSTEGRQSYREPLEDR
jgi:hypothetical protein